MKNKKVLISLKLPKIAKILLEQAGLQVVTWDEEQPMQREELKIRAKDHNAILSTGSIRFDRDLIEQCSHIDIISQYAVGYDNIDINAAKEFDIALANTPGTMTDSTADTAFALMLAVARNMFYLQNTIIKGEWKYFSAVNNLGIELKEKTLGIFGLGRIGMEMAKRCKGAYDMNIIYTNRNINLEAESQCGAKFVDFQTLLKDSDIISVHCNLSHETKHTFDKVAFEQMKETAIFINTARGAVHHEADLIDALRKEQIWGAGLDVTDPEPMHSNNPLLRMKNVVVLPHVGSGTIEARNAMAEIAAKNIISFFKTGKPIHQIL